MQHTGPTKRVRFTRPVETKKRPFKVDEVVEYPEAQARQLVETGVATFEKETPEDHAAAAEPVEHRTAAESDPAE